MKWLMRLLRDWGLTPNYEIVASLFEVFGRYVQHQMNVKSEACVVGTSPSAREHATDTRAILREAGFYELRDQIRRVRTDNDCCEVRSLRLSSANMCECTRPRGLCKTKFAYASK